MWEAEVNCPECESTHRLNADVKSMPRVFGYRCPSVDTDVSIRFRDPSVMSSSWKEVSQRSEGTLPVSSTESGGAMDL